MLNMILKVLLPMKLVAMLSPFLKMMSERHTGHIGIKKMCERFEQSYVDQNYSFEDCLDDWVVVNWAWKVDK